MSVTQETIIAALERALQAQKIDTARIGPTINASVGQGLRAHKANLDLDAILARVEAAPEAERERLIGGFASGARAVLGEPPRSTASQWTFAKSAASMLCAIEVETFALGVQAASDGQTPWSLPLPDGLILTAYVGLDGSRHIITRAQVEAWGTTDDRIVSASRSMLFHRTRDHRFAPLPEHQGVFALHVGDGHDAARAMIATDLFFLELDEARFWFAMPHEDQLLFVQSPQALPALEAATASAVAASSAPLSARVFKLERGLPALLEAQP